MNLTYLGLLLFDCWHRRWSDDWYTRELWQLSILYYHFWSIKNRCSLPFVPEPCYSHYSKVTCIFRQIEIEINLNFCCLSDPHSLFFVTNFCWSRYKLVVKMEQNGEKANFHFWDAVCIKIFGKTADECRQELIAVSYLYYKMINEHKCVFKMVFYL